MKVLFDTNVWLDVITNRQPFYCYSKAALLACIEDEIEIEIVATSLKDIFYLVARNFGAQKAYEAIEQVLSIATIAPADELICSKAIDLERPDYEDGVIAAAAYAEHVGCIVSRDRAAFKSIDIHTYAPEEFLYFQGYEEIEF